jgi:hypothetical protein
LGRSGNADGKHELTLMRRSGEIEGVLTPNIDVLDVGIGCGD